MTRAKVILFGLFVLALGAIGFAGFSSLGFDEASAGIAAQTVLFVVVLGWTGSYLFRVVNGKMTFMEQRKRYREAYEELTDAELKSRFESMSEKDQILLMSQLEDQKDSFQVPSDE